MTENNVTAAEAAPKKRGRKFAFNRGQLCLPYGVFLLFCVILPLFIVVYYAFTDGSGAFTFYNFAEFFTNKTKISTLLISVIAGFAVTVLCILIAYPVAYILSKMNGKTATILLLLFITPTWINFVLRAMAMKEILTILQIPLGNVANIIGLVYDFLPFMIMPIYSTLIKMDKSLEEAALDLGANRAKVFCKITLPLSLPGVISGAMMVFLPVMSCYVVTDTFSGSSGFTVIGKLIAWCFLGEGGTLSDVNAGATISLVLLLIMFLTMAFTGGFKRENNGRSTSL